MKTFILNLTFSCMILVTLPGCLDLGGFDLGIWEPSWGGTYYGGGYYEPTYSSTFYTDSVVQISDSKIKIWAQIRYDSVLTIENRTVSYWNSTNENVMRVIQLNPSTINFKELPDSTLAWTGKYEGIYKYTVELDSLEKDFEYVMQLTNGYTEKGVFKYSQNWISVQLK